MHSTNSILHIIEGCKKNDIHAQTALYKELAALLFGVCLRYIKSKAAAEDCLQEAFIKIFTHIHSYRGDGPFEAWARRITVNEILSQFRRKDVLTESLELENVEQEFSSGNQDVYDDLSHEELLNFILQLPESKRIVFNLYVIEGYSHKEIGEILNINEGTSKSQLFKAKQLLAEIHKKYNPDHA